MRQMTIKKNLFRNLLLSVCTLTSKFGGERHLTNRLGIDMRHATCNKCDKRTGTNSYDGTIKWMDGCFLGMAYLGTLL